MPFQLAFMVNIFMMFLSTLSLVKTNAFGSTLLHLYSTLSFSLFFFYSRGNALSAHYYRYPSIHTCFRSQSKKVCYCSCKSSRQVRGERESAVTFNAKRGNWCCQRRLFFYWRQS